MFDITNYADVKERNGLWTKRIQAAVDDCASKGGGTVNIPAGEYVCGTVYLKDDVNLYLERGAVLLGAPFEEFDPDEKVEYPLYQDASHSFFHCSMFVAENRTNVSVTGFGKIDMRSYWDEKNVRDMVHRGAKALAFRNCRNVTLTDFAVYNATDLGVYLAGCENVKIDRLTLDVYIDGISPDCCKNVTVSNCIITAGDDGIVVKSSYTLNRLADSENINVTNCIINSRCNAIKFGTESNGGLYNFNVSNCTIYNTRLSGIVLGTMDGGEINGVNINGIVMKNVGTPIFVKISKRYRGPKEHKRPGKIKNVIISNLISTGPFCEYRMKELNYASFCEKRTLEKSVLMPSTLIGSDESRLENVRLSNIHLEVEGGYTGETPAFTDDKYDSYQDNYIYGKELPANAVYIRHGKNIVAENVTAVCVNPDSRKSVVLEDCE